MNAAPSRQRGCHHARASCSLSPGGALQALDIPFLPISVLRPGPSLSSGRQDDFWDLEVIHVVCPPCITPILWGLQQSVDKAEGQQAVRRLCEAPWRQETLGLA